MIDRLVKVRMRRQQVLDRDSAVKLAVVLDESVLQRRIGTDRVMAEQLQRLEQDANRPNVEVRILPLDGEHSVFGESFVIFRFGEDGEASLQDVVSTEHLTSDFSLEGERETYLHWIAFKTLAREALGPAESKKLIRKTADHWSGSQRDT
jgi:hypothetical protein